MPVFKAIIHMYALKGEKTRWSYIELPIDVLSKLKLKSCHEFRIKGVMDDVKFPLLVCYPVKDSGFIIAINDDLRKKLVKKEGATASGKFELDKNEALKSNELHECMADDTAALKQYESLLISHPNYFYRYIYTAKGADTKAGLLVNVRNATHKKHNLGETIRSLKQKV